MLGGVATVVVFGQGGLEIGCGDMVWASLISTPLHEEAIAQAQHYCENQHSVVVAHPAAVVVVGDVQALMQTVLMPQASQFRRTSLSHPVARAQHW